MEATISPPPLNFFFLWGGVRGGMRRDYFIKKIGKKNPNFNAKKK
jgi:hypothetical protein